MKKPKLLIVSASLVLSGCAGSKLATEFKKDNSDFTVETSTSACFGTCPVFKLSVDSDGSAVFEGIHYTKLEGEHQKKLSSTEVDSLKQLILENNFFELDSVYNDIRVSDLPSTTISVSLKEHGQTKKVMGRYNEPQSFENIEAYIFRLVKRNFDQ